MSRLLLIIILFLTGCAAYLEDRRHDLIDVASLNSEGVSVGMKANVSALNAGIYALSSPSLGVGLSSGSSPGIVHRIGLGGYREAEREEGVLLLGLTATEEKDAYRRNSRWGYGHEISPFGSVGFNLGVLYGVGAKIDFLEALDFVLGLLLIDIIQDDTVSAGEYWDYLFDEDPEPVKEEVPVSN